VFGAIENFLAALADPSSKNHEVWSQWMERDFDPKEFSIDIVNARIGARLKSQPA